MKRSLIRVFLVVMVVCGLLIFSGAAYAEEAPEACTVSISKHPGDSSTFTNDGFPYSSTWFSVKAIGVDHYCWEIKYPNTDIWYTIPEPDVTEEWVDGLILTVKLHLRTHQDIVDHVGCRYRCILFDANGNKITTKSATIISNPPAYDPYIPCCPPCCPPPYIPCPYVPCCPCPPETFTTIVVTTTTTTTTTVS